MPREALGAIEEPLITRSGKAKALLGGPRSSGICDDLRYIVSYLRHPV